MKNLTTAPSNLYSIDFTNNKIVISKEFIRRASVYNSKEYNLMMSFKRELPEFEIELLSKKRDNSSPHLSFDVMEAYITKTFGAESDHLKEFYNILEYSKLKKSGRYSFMKNWFHEVYPAGYNLLCQIKDNSEIIKQNKENARKWIEGIVSVKEVKPNEAV